ncbi:MAG: sugar ABC transporter permease [Sumerlaeia bacterium]
MKMTRTDRHQLASAALFLSPWIIGFTVFVALPAILSLYFSLCDYSVLTEPVFIGVGNYTDLTRDALFWKSLWNTILFAGLALPIGTVVSIALALLLNSPMWGKGIMRTIVFLPSLVPLVAMGMLWQYLLNPEYGLINGILQPLGLASPDWLGDPSWTKPGLVLTTLWGTGNAVIIYLASLSEVPRTLYDAARVDGASWWQQILNISLPMISPVIYFNMIIGIITVLQIFALPYVMMGADGEPARSTLFYAMYLFNQAFTYLRMGYASAMAWILFLLIALLTWAGHRASRRHVHYGGA